MTLETVKNIMRFVDPDISEAELEEKATMVATHSELLDAIDNAVAKESTLKTVQMHSVVRQGRFCIHFTYVNTIKKWNTLTAVMNKFVGKTELVAETMTTMTYALIGMRR